MEFPLLENFGVNPCHTVDRMAQIEMCIRDRYKVLLLVREEVLDDVNAEMSLEDTMRMSSTTRLMSVLKWSSLALT